MWHILCRVYFGSIGGFLVFASLHKNTTYAPGLAPARATRRPATLGVRLWVLAGGLLFVYLAIFVSSD